MNLIDFKNGDLVHHKTRLYLKMLVIDILNNEVKCSWITKKGIREIENFYAFELEHEEELKIIDKNREFIT